MAADPLHVYRLLSVAAHDIRGPLSGIKGMSELVLSDGANLTNEQRECLSLMHRASSDLIAMLNDLLDYSIIEQERLELKRIRLDLTRLVQDRVRIQGAIAAGKRIVIECIAEAEAIFVIADRRRIAQAIDNLLSNAIKFSPLGSRVLVAVRRHGEAQCQIEVRDTGPGIPAGQVGELFTAFAPLGTKTTGGETCTGLGLALVKRLVDLHQGELRIENVPPPESGVVATITLPALVETETVKGNG